MCACVCRNGVTFELSGTKLPSRNIPVLCSHQQRLNVFKVRILRSVVKTSCSWQRCFYFRKIYARLFLKFGIICSRLRGEAEASPRTVCFQSPHFPFVLCYLIV